jgi:hypothetical protein
MTWQHGLRDIRSLFRRVDVEAMAFAFDLSSFDDFRENAERVTDGDMPCDEPWPDEQVERFRAWIDAGTPP